MTKKLIVGLVVVGLVLGMAGMAVANPPGQRTPVYLVNAAGHIDGTTNFAKAWRSGKFGYYCNFDQCFVFTHRASMAQWIDFLMTATVVDWEILKPFFERCNGPIGGRDPLVGKKGFAIDCISLYLRSNGDVGLYFDRLGDLKNKEGDIIPTWFALMRPNQKPGPKDWIRAGSLKGKVILEDQRHKRMCFKLWIKIKPHPSDSACEYKNKGKVRVKALEQKCWVTDC